MKKMFLRRCPFIGLVLCSGLFIIGNSLANLQMPALLADIVNNGVAMGDSDYVTHTGIRMLGVAFFAVCCSLGTTYCSSRIATGFSSRLRARKLFYKVTVLLRREDGPLRHRVPDNPFHQPMSARSSTS